MPTEPSGLPPAQRSSGAGRRVCAVAIAILVVAYVALLLPESRFKPPAGAGKRPFVWNQNQVWAELEQQFLKARQSDPIVLDQRLDELFARAGQSVNAVGSKPMPPGDSAFTALETNLFGLSPLVAARPKRIREFAALVDKARAVTKKASETWDLKEAKAREQLYRILFGGRMALEMVMVQAPEGAGLPAVCRDEPSATPGVMLGEVTWHSGDILVSRGDAPTSSLIARGNDYPGNFSHVALLHVDERTAKATIIESLIECGLRTTTLSNFLGEKRLRLMALRLRADVPAVRADPQLPHRAATFALQAAGQRHTPYDFAMDFRDHRAQFCSEVVSSAYEQVGVRLWMGMTHISSPTVTAWLASAGVRHFETQEPSDLEYDPQLRVIAEWRSPTNLFQAHLDDAVTDSMFETATPRAPLPYSLLKLPLARAVKACSAGLNALGRIGPIPEGMSSTAALRVSRFRQEHRARKERLAKAAAEFQARNGYLPPYWELIKMATPAAEPARVP